MEREIKFRTYDKVRKMYLTVEALNMPLNPISEALGEIANPQIYKDRYALEQYTGVKDRNGKDIYENDIVRLIAEPGLDRVGVVEFRNGCFWVIWDNGYEESAHPLFLTSKEFQDMGATIKVQYEFEVLGNIHIDSLLLAN